LPDRKAWLKGVLDGHALHQGVLVQGDERMRFENLVAFHLPKQMRLQ